MTGHRIGSVWTWPYLFCHPLGSSWLTRLLRWFCHCWARQKIEIDHLGLFLSSSSSSQFPGFPLLYFSLWTDFLPFSFLCNRLFLLIMTGFFRHLGLNQFLHSGWHTWVLVNNFQTCLPDFHNRNKYLVFSQSKKNYEEFHFKHIWAPF